MNYCSNCGARVASRIPADDDRPRFICDSCHTVHYENPKVVVGCIPEWEDRILLCRRAIEPCYGLWTLPAGFLENGETVEEGARREAFEEVRADVKILSLYTLLNLTQINQIYLLFRAHLVEQSFKAGHETLEARLFTEPEIPWDDLAFLSIKETLKLYFLDRPTGAFPLHMGRIPDD